MGSQKYVPPHRRQNSPEASSHPNNNNNRGTLLFVGDSFIRPFGLVENPRVRVHGLTGASAKGLTREGNENRATLQRLLQRHQQRLERVVLCFGSVDVHMSHYHVRVNKHEELDLEGVARGYVEFVQTLRTAQAPHRGRMGVPFTLVGVYPSPLDDDDVRDSLTAYGTVQPDQLHLLDAKADVSLAARQGRVRRFNEALRAGCELYNGLEFCDAGADMLDPATGRIKTVYRDVSLKNIHVVWETTVMLWMRRWPWYRALATPGLEGRLQSSLEDYLKTKPWAKREHPASALGIQTALRREEEDGTQL